MTSQFVHRGRYEILVCILMMVVISGCQGNNQAFQIQEGTIVPDSILDSANDEHGEQALEWELDDIGGTEFVVPFACNRATNAQITEIKRGNEKFDKFLKACWAATNNSRWCEQLTRPNPSSRSVFTCTYGSSLPHKLIHPDEKTWSHAFKAVQFVTQLESAGISVKQIYNWWRPEPYNKNVGGAAVRHPYGTSVDVRFSTLSNMEKAHSQLCKWRAQGKLRAVGYYGSTGLHFGIGDKLANTWGKACK